MKNPMTLFVILASVLGKKKRAWQRKKGRKKAKWKNRASTPPLPSHFLKKGRMVESVRVFSFRDGSWRRFRFPACPV
jgi:hypothetical protein